MSKKELVFFYPENHVGHAETGHPERPERVETIQSMLVKRGLFEKYPLLEPNELPFEILYTIHDQNYLDRLKKSSQLAQRFDMDTYLTQQSWQLALNAAGGATAVAESVWKGEAKRGFALCRPPGHHATHNQAMGFCLINNIAVAAEYLLQVHGAKRLAIVDIDVHHGNGTQDIFWQRSEVPVFSIHQLPLYPMSGYLQETGEGDGEGYTVNLPLPPFSGDQARITAFDRVVLPILYRYQPEMVLVSYGYDAHWRDPLAQQLTSADNYGQSISKLIDWCDRSCEGRLAVFLEGGYDIEAGKACTMAVTQALLGEPWEDPLGPSPRDEGNTWEEVINQAVGMWDA